MTDTATSAELTAQLAAAVGDANVLTGEAIAEVGPHGHFFGCQHTQDRYQSAFYQPFLSDWRNYEAPPLDPAIAEELAAFVERRRAEGGAPTDF